MPNTFGPGGSTAQYQLIDPREVRSSRSRFARDMIPELAYANSLYIPTGRYPAKGWILLRRQDYNALPNLYSTSFQLAIEDFKSYKTLTSSKLTFKNLAIVQARCVSRGSSADPNAIYLVEITDRRGVLYNEWFQYPTTSQYNLRAPAYDGSFYDGSLNGGVRWTWDGLIQDLWNQMNTFLGPYPGLPIGPTDVPEGWNFAGCSAWEAMTTVLNLLGLEVACDLTQSNPYTIVNAGMADTAFTSLQGRYSGLLLDDMEWIDVGAGRVPRQVIVYFRRRNQYRGTEETVRKDSLQWQTSYVYSVTVAGPPPHVNSQGTHYIWSDFTVRYDVDNNPLAADTATAATVAASESAAYYNRIYRQTAGYLWQLYAGALPFVTGSLVDGVCYRQDFRENFERQGWLTEVIRGPAPPWPQVDCDW